VGEEPKECLIVNDEFCVRRFGSYQETLDDMIRAAVSWVKSNGDYWGKPTKFGEVKREY
jgi:hypothetical protein